MVFKSEVDFENALIKMLQKRGWEEDVIKNPTEQDLLDNWAHILFQNNRSIDRLNDVPLTKGEMQQIMSQIYELRTPVRLNGFINGRSVIITRDNPRDRLHFGKEVSLKIYDRQEIAAGQSRYQIAQQPRLMASSTMRHNRKGDLMLLINGMPVIHIELKQSGIPVIQACNQIEKYSKEGLFTGIFALIQIFVAMSPEETRYFANPGSDGTFNPDFYFQWADVNNEPINHWAEVTTRLLSIPMAHQLIGFYTVADDSDGVLKVMRSYQFYAANAISDRVAKTNWKESRRRGGYIWHTTGSGKTMTSFKSAQLIANSKDADKVVFLMDRIELGTQSLRAYRDFADANEEVQSTEDTQVLINKLKSTDPNDTMIVTSIQKLSNIDDEKRLMAEDIRIMNKKRIVIIVDEAHRSTFGDMLITIKRTFPDALFFGFTGTPIHDENEKKKSTTATIFGDELHRYSIADGIRDNNVLGFDVYKVLTFQDEDLREAVALQEANTSDISQIVDDPVKMAIYHGFMDSKKVPMAGYYTKSGEQVKGIEGYVPRDQYLSEDHRQAVVDDILKNWKRLNYGSYGSRFHGIFATNSIAEAIEYYRLFKQMGSNLKITCLFDPSIDNGGNVQFKSDGLEEILTDYNAMYEQDFTIPSYARFKKDVASRLAHKKPYLRIHQEPENQLDLLIVVQQMLTGFDSKWVKTLFLDRVLEYENVIQAFSRTNRLFGQEKPFGTIRYYRYPHTMENNIQRAIKLYSGDKPTGLFVEKLDYNLEKMNQIYADIERLFKYAGIPDYSKLPADITECAKFAKLFNEFNDYLEAAKVQGFAWEELTYKFTDPRRRTTVDIDKATYFVLVLRYKELGGDGPGDGPGGNAPFDVRSHLTAIHTDRIDSDYMNSRFEKYLRALEQDISPEALQLIEEELHSSFASLTQQQQKYAGLFMNDFHRGELILEEDTSLSEYITDYEYRAKNKELGDLAEALGLDIRLLERFMAGDVTENNIDEFGRFRKLKNSVDRDKAKSLLEVILKETVSQFRLNLEIDKLLKDFILKGGYEIPELVKKEES